MSVKLFFGLPGSGKTTILAKLAYDGVKSKRYRYVYSNVRLSIFGVTYISNDCIGKYDLSDCLLLIDEATLFADNRAYKEFTKDKIEYFLLHRHYNSDIVLFTQQWDGVDRKIRVITDRVYYVYKGFFTGFWFSKYYRIPYDIIIPDPHKKSDGQKLGEIIQGYCKPNILVRMFATYVFRPNFYKYFDSWQRPQLDPLPRKYTQYYEVIDGQIVKSAKEKARIRRKQNKTIILLRSLKQKISSWLEVLPSRSRGKFER